MNDREYWSYISLGVYVVVGAVSRYSIIPFCQEGLENLTFSLEVGAIPLILVAIGFGLFYFIFPKRNKTRIATGMVTGLSVGFGGMTVYDLLFVSCL